MYVCMGTILIDAREGWGLPSFVLVRGMVYGGGIFARLLLL